MLKNFSSVPSDEIFLFEQSRKLYTAWVKFCKQVSEEQGQNISTDVPSLKQLLSSVQQASDSWEIGKKNSWTGKVKGQFSHLCRSVQEHSALLSVVPKDDKYVCLLTGSISAIAKVGPKSQSASCRRH
jgi:hypothetical protein